MSKIKNILCSFDITQKQFAALLIFFVLIIFPFTLANCDRYKTAKNRRTEIQNLEFKIGQYNNKSSAGFYPLLKERDLNKDISDIKSLLENHDLFFIKSDTTSTPNKDTINYQINGSYLKFLSFYNSYLARDLPYNLSSLDITKNEKGSLYIDLSLEIEKANETKQ